MNNFFYEYTKEKVVRTNLERAEKIPIKGKRVSSFLKEGKLFSEKEVFFITEQLLDILGEMRSGFPPVLHKSISPSNIIIKKGWEIALIGFNAEKSNKNYIAPEGLSSPTPKSDLYSAGKVLLDLSKNTTINDNFKKFIKVMTKINPDNRFKDIKTAQFIFKKIKNGSIQDSDWSTEEKRAFETNNFSKQEAAIHSEFNQNLNNLNGAMYRQRHYRGRRYGGSWYSLLLLIPIFIFISYFNNNDDDCDTAPRGYYNDEKCNLHPKSQAEMKRDITKKNRKEKKLKEKWKKSGLTGKR